MAFIWLKHLLRPLLKNYEHPKVSTYVSMSDPQYNGEDKIIQICVKGMWIKHGALAAMGSFFTYPLVGQAIKHHWIEVETDNGLYSVQFHGGLNSLFIHKKHSTEDILKEATKAAGMDEINDKQVKDVFPIKYITEDKNMDDLLNIVEAHANIGKYNLVLNNCQDFSAVIYNWCCENYIR